MIAHNTNMSSGTASTLNPSGAYVSILWNVKDYSSLSYTRASGEEGHYIVYFPKNGGTPTRDGSFSSLTGKSVSAYSHVLIVGNFSGGTFKLT